MPKANQTRGTGSMACSAHTYQESEEVTDIPGNTELQQLIGYLKARNAYELCIWE